MEHELSEESRLEGCSALINIKDNKSLNQAYSEKLLTRVCAIEKKSPEKIVKVTLEPWQDLQPYQARRLAFALGLKGNQIKSGINTFYYYEWT